VSLTTEILEEFSTDIDNWALIPSGGGVFELVINGDLAFSKKAQGRYPETAEVRSLIKQAM